MRKLFLGIREISKWTRRIAIVSGVLLLVSLAGVVAAHALPTEVEQETTLLNYEHKGRFDYLVYLKPSYIFGPEPQEPPPLPPNPKYPTEIIDSIDMSFTYGTETEMSQRVEVKAVLENPGIWQKEITLVPRTNKTGDFTIDFPLDIDEINELFDTIEEEIKITSSSRNVTIVATVGRGSAAFTHSLPIILRKTLIEVDSNLTKIESGAAGEFDYWIYLKENSLFDTETLRPPLVIPFTPLPPKTIGPGEVIFSKLVDRMDATYYYDFKSDQPVRGRTEEVEITATLENPEVWSKTFVLVPRTRESGDFRTSFPVDINHFTEVLEAIRSETEVSAESYNLTIKADVHTVAQTDFGRIDEVFSQTLSSALGRGTLEWNEELVDSKPGAMTASQMIPNPNKYVGLSVSGVRILAAVMTGILFLLFAYLVWFNLKVKPVAVPKIEKEIRLVNKKYGERMAEATSQTPLEGEKIISIGSMEDLIKVADELGKPIIHQAPTTPEEAHAYYVFDGATRYQYVLSPRGKERRSNAGKTEQF